MYNYKDSFPIDSSNASSHIPINSPQSYSTVQGSHRLHAEPEFPKLLLVVVGTETTNSKKNQWHWGSSSSLDYSGGTEASEKGTIRECKLGAVILVFLQEIA